MKVLLFCLFYQVSHFTFSQECFLVVSSGGGFTGVATVYQINPDGKVLKGKGLGKVNYSEQSQLKKSVARKYYLKTQKLVRSGPAFNHPGNIYYSLAAQEKDNLLKVTWGDTEHAAPEQARILYQEITKILSVLSFTPKTP